MQLKLTMKFTVVTSIVLLVAMILFAVINIKHLEDMCFNEALKDADNLGETIIRTTHYQMLEDDRERVYQMIEEVAEQPEIERIRLFNKNGIINYSTVHGEIGTSVDRSAEGCDGCHSEEKAAIRVPSMERSRVYQGPEGGKILGLTKEISNQPTCYTKACHFHSQESEVLGILDVHMALDEMQATLANYRNKVVLFSMLLLFSLAACIALLTREVVNVPVQDLLEHTRKMGRGELDGHIENHHRDELGELAEAFNNMTQNLAQAQQKLKEWADTLEARVVERTRENQEMQAQLVRAEKLASLGELAAGIAHEINNPLTGILMYGNLAEQNPNLDSAVRADLEIIIGETRRCAHIVKGLLEFGRETTPDKKLDSIHRILERTLALVEGVALFQDIRIVRAYEEELPNILVDPDQIGQVFMNMLVNAGQAMPQGGDLTLQTGLEQEMQGLYVQISDEGHGISEEDLKKIFDPFFSTKKEEGNGLGLSVSHGIIQNHHGGIDVQSEVGKGTSFTIWLPFAAPETSVPSQQGARTGMLDS